MSEIKELALQLSHVIHRGSAEYNTDIESISVRFHRDGSMYATVKQTTRVFIPVKEEI